MVKIYAICVPKEIRNKESEHCDYFKVLHYVNDLNLAKNIILKYYKIHKKYFTRVYYNEQDDFYDSDETKYDSDGEEEDEYTMYKEEKEFCKNNTEIIEYNNRKIYLITKKENSYEDYENNRIYKYYKIFIKCFDITNDNNIINEYSLIHCDYSSSLRTFLEILTNKDHEFFEEIKRYYLYSGNITDKINNIKHLRQDYEPKYKNITSRLDITEYFKYDNIYANRYRIILCINKPIINNITNVKFKKLSYDFYN